MIAPRNSVAMRRDAGLGRRLATTLMVVALLVGCGETPEQMLASAKAYLANGKRNAAVIQLKNALQKDGELAEARFLLGKLQLEQGDVRGAVKELRRAAELGYSPREIAPLLARALLRANDFDGVINEFGERQIDDSIARAQLLAVVGDAYLAKSDIVKARAAYTDAIAANPDDALARVGLARTRLLEGEVDGVLADLDAIIADHPKAAEAHALRADALLAADRLEEATAALVAAVEAAPNVVPYHSALVSLLLRQDRFDEAAKRLKAMQAVAPQHPSTLYHKAYLDFRGGRQIEARDALVKVAQAAPDFLPAKVLYGAVLMRLNDHHQAQAELDKVVAKAPGLVLARRLMAQSLLVTRNPDRAFEVIRPMLDAGLRDAVTTALAGEILLAKGDFDQAAEYFALAVKGAPENVAARTRLGVARLRQGDAERAFADLEAASALDEDTSQPDIVLILAHLRHGQTDEALLAQQRLEKKQPDKAQTYNLKGAVLLAKKDVAGARAAFERALTIDARSLAAVMNLARLDVAGRDHARALQRLDAFLQGDPGSIPTLLAKAEVIAGSGGASAEILKPLEQAVKANPTALAPKVALVRQHLKDRQPKQALSVAQAAVAASPDEPQALELLGRTQAETGDVQQAISTYQRLATLQPLSPAPLLQVAQVQRKAGNDAAAETTLRKALGIKPDAVETRLGLIAIMIAGKRRDDALGVARELQGLRSENAAGYLLEGEVHAAFGAWDEAAAAFRKATALDNPGTAPVKLYVALQRAGKASDADKMAAEWLRKHPKDLLLRAELGQQALSSERYRDAEGQFRKMLEVAPDNAAVLNNLAWVAGKLGDPKALEYAQRAIAKAPNSPAILDTLGMLQAKSGMADRGLENQRRAVALAPKVSGLRLNLAKTYLQMQRKDEARKELEIVLGEVAEGTPLHAEASRLRQGL